MENTINISSGLQAFASTTVQKPQARNTSAYVEPKKAAVPVVESAKEEPRIPEGEQARQEYVERAAESYRAMFPMSGVSFAIFKDSSSGEYITRFTNLADGTVTQIPEPELIDFYVRSQGGEAPLVRLES